MSMVERMGADKATFLVLGLGNVLLTDEQVGVRVAEAVARDPRAGTLGVRGLDGGTMGLSLLVDMEDAEALVVVDAAQLGADPGTIELFEGVEMDRFLRTRGRNPHDIGLDDILDGLRLREAMPAQRALVGIQPAELGIGEAMTGPVAAALPQAVDAIFDLISDWQKSQIAS